MRTTRPSPAVPTVTGQPIDQTVTAGQTATFTAAADGTPAPTVQWQVSTDGGTTFTDVIGATADTLTVTGTTTAESGNGYRAVYTNTNGSAISSSAALTVKPVSPTVTTQPIDQTVSDGQSATFTAAADGAPAPAVQWQVSIDGATTFTAIPFATADSLTVAGTTTESGNEYRAVFINTAGSAISSAATLTVNPVPPAAPTVTTQPHDQTVTAGQSATFTAAADGAPAPTVQWFVSTDGGWTFTDMIGATADTLTITGATTAESGNQYQAVFTNTVHSATSALATLTVNPPPVPAAPTVTAPPIDQTVTAGQSATFTAAADGTPAPTVQWQVSTDAGTTFSDVTGATGNTLTVTGTTLAESGNAYRAVFTNTNGGTTSAPATLTVNPASTPPPGMPSAPMISNLPGSGTVGGSFTAEVVTNSGGTKSVTSSTTDECTVAVDGLTVYYAGAGTCTLTAHVAATTTYTAADGAAQSFAVGGFTPVGPVRILDTRTGTGAPTAPVGPHGTITLTVPGLPAGTTAVVVNLTGTGLTGAPQTFVSACPAAQALTSCTKTSALNPVAGGTAPNEITVPVGPDGRITLYNNAGSINLIADLAGYQTGGYAATGPVRILDTRTGTGAPTAPVGPHGTITLTVPGLPAGTTAVVLNLTGTGLTGAPQTFVSACPAAQALTSCTKTSALNPVAGGTAPNEITVPVGPDGRITLYNNAGSINLIADLAGYVT